MAIDEGAGFLEGDLSPAKLQEMMKNAKVVLAAVRQFYSAQNENLTQLTELFAERNVALIKEKEMLEKYGRSTFDKDLEIKERQFAQSKTESIAKLLRAEVDGLSVIDAANKRAAELGGEFSEQFEEILGTDSETSKMYHKMEKTIISAGGDIGRFRAAMRDQSDAIRAEGQLIYLEAAKAKVLKGNEAAEQLTEFTTIIKENFKNINQSTKGLMTSLFGLKDMSKSWQMAVLTTEGGFAAMGKSIKEMLSPANMMLNIITGIAKVTKDLVFSMDRVIAGYSKGGGLIEQDRDVILSASTTAQRMGISEETIGKSGEALSSLYQKFSLLNARAREDLMVTVSMLEQVGVSASTSAKLMNTLTAELGNSWSESLAIIMEVEQAGREMGIAAKPMLENFESALKTLAMYGNQAKDIFVELAKEAKRLGVEINTLLKLEEKFLTFGDSAEVAGKLNAIAGKIVLDPVKLMMATGEEQTKMLESAMKATNMRQDARGIKFMANALGISPGEVQAILKQNDDVPEKQSSDFQEVMKMSITLADKFKNMLKSMAVAVGPLLQVLTWLIEVLQVFVSVWDGWLVKGPMIIVGIAMVIRQLVILASTLKAVTAVGIVSSIAGGIKAALVWVWSYITGKKAQVVAEVAATAALDAQTASLAANTLALQANAAAVAEHAAAMSATAPAAAAAAPAVGGFAATMAALSSGAAGILALGAALLMVAAAMWVLSKSFRGWEELGGTLVLFTAVVTGLIVSGKLLAKATPHLMLGAAGVAALGLAFMTISLAMLMLMKAVDAASFDSMIGFAGGLVALGGGFLAFSLSAAIALPLMLFAGPVFNKFITVLKSLAETVPSVAPMMTVLSDGLVTLGSAFLTFVGQMIRAGVKIFFAMGSYGLGFGKLKSAISMLSGALQGLDIDAISSFNTMLVNMMRLSEKASAFSIVARGIREVSSALVELNLANQLTGAAGVSVLSTMTGESGRGIERTINAVKSLEDDNINKFEKLVNISKEFNTVTKESGESTGIKQFIEKTTAMLTGASGAVGAAAGEAGKDIVVKVMIDEREIGRAIVPVVREQLFGKGILG
jgi:hypothetical protein